MASEHSSDEVLMEVLKTPEMLRVLRHMHLAKVDYAKNTTRYTDIPQMRVTGHLKRLCSLKLLDIYENTSIKRTAAKLKKSAEVHKHHTYYQINRNGDILLKDVTPENYFRLIGPDTIGALCHMDKLSDHPEMVVTLKEFYLIDDHNKITELGTEVLNYGKSKQKVRC
jgi:predicted transcriptional regulator